MCVKDKNVSDQAIQNIISAFRHTLAEHAIGISLAHFEPIFHNVHCNTSAGSMEQLCGIRHICLGETHLPSNDHFSVLKFLHENRVVHLIHLENVKLNFQCTKLFKVITHIQHYVRAEFLRASMSSNCVIQLLTHSSVSVG
jgi:hypothetical protein